MSDNQTYAELRYEYDTGMAAYAAGFREDLIARGVTISDPDQIKAWKANYDLKHHEELARLEALGALLNRRFSEMETQTLAIGERAAAAAERAAAAHELQARFAAQFDDTLRQRQGD